MFSIWGNYVCSASGSAVNVYDSSIVSTNHSMCQSFFCDKALLSSWESNSYLYGSFDESIFSKRVQGSPPLLVNSVYLKITRRTFINDINTRIIMHLMTCYLWRRLITLQLRGLKCSEKLDTSAIIKTLYNSKNTIRTLVWFQRNRSVTQGAVLLLLSRNFMLFHSTWKQRLI